MKAILTIAIVCAIAVAIGTQGCSKSGSTNSAQADTAYMKAIVQGLAFSATGATGAYAGSSSSGGITYLYIYGVATDGQAIQLTLVNNPGVGVTQLANGSLSGTAFYYPSGSLQGSYTAASNGTITITALTPNLKGTFSFITTDNKTIADGTFSVPPAP